MGASQNQNDELDMILELETRQRQEEAAREALGQKPRPTSEKPEQKPPSAPEQAP